VSRAPRIGWVIGKPSVVEAVTTQRAILSGVRRIKGIKVLSGAGLHGGAAILYPRHDHAFGERKMGAYSLRPRENCSPSAGETRFE